MGLWGLIKLGLIALAVYWLYRGVKNLMGGQERKSVRYKKSQPGEVLDVMVQDPQCGTYVPQHDSVRAWVGGKEYFFCSKKCRDEFVEKQGDSK